VTVDVASAVALSLQVAAASTLLSLVPAVLVGRWLAMGQVPGKSVLTALVLVPLVLPPVVTGLLLLDLFGRHGPLGGVLEPLGVRITFTRPRVVFAEPGKRADLRIVGERRDRRDPRIRRRAARECVEPVARDDRVGIEQHDICARQRHAAIRRRGEPDIARIGKQRDARIAALLEFAKDVAHAAIRRRIVDQHETKRSCREREHARHAAPQVVRGVVDRDDDVDGSFAAR
jgi:hypothetical protein